MTVEFSGAIQARPNCHGGTVMATGNSEHRHPSFVEDVEISGHIIDSLILPKVLDEIAALGGRHHILDINVGERRQDPSFARLKVEADSRESLEKILASI